MSAQSRIGTVRNCTLRAGLAIVSFDDTLVNAGSRDGATRRRRDVRPHEHRVALRQIRRCGMRRGMRRAAFAVVTALAVLAACGSEGSPTAVETASLFVVPDDLATLSQATFFDHPFPSDLRREADGTVRFAGWPNPFSIPLLRDFLAAMDHHLDGFSPATAIYLRFNAPIDPATLPADPPASLASDASVQLVDVDPASPERGKRRLVSTHWRDAEGAYWQPNTLAVMPMIGAPLRAKTRYALVVTKKVHGAGGGAIGRSPDLDEVLGLVPATPRTERARAIYTPAIAELAATISATDIVHLTVFTTNDPTAELFAIADALPRDVAAPSAQNWAKRDDGADYAIYEGTYGPSPNYQGGTIPYRLPADGGDFVFEAGAPKLQGTFDLRFALAVPSAATCPPPANGYPIVLYAHGTGGDYRSFVDDGTARSLARQCLASMGVDQIFHGTRPGSPPESDPTRESTIQLLFFNFNNARAARTNNRQSAIDVVQQARLFTETKVTVPAEIAKGGAAIAFDPSKVLFFGHSQGGLNGPLFLAATGQARGGVLSGAGSLLTIALLEKTKPIDVSAAVRLLVGLSDADMAPELNVFHPAMTLAQTLVDATDPVHYARFITTEPRTGNAPKSIYQTEGIAADGSGDTYAPPHGIEALAVALGLPRVAPGVRPIQEAVWSGLADVTVGEGLRGNLAGGRATGAIAQFVPTAGNDGHFVVFDDARANRQAATFCRALADDPVGKLTP